MDILTTILFLISIFIATWITISTVMQLASAIVIKKSVNFAFETIVISICVTYNCWYLFVRGL